MKRTPALLLITCNLMFFWPVLFHGRVFSSHDCVLAEWPWRAHSGVLEPRNRLLNDPATSAETHLRHIRDFPEGFFWNRSSGGGVPGPINFVQGNLSPFSWLPALALPESAIETGILWLKLNFGFLFAFVYFRSRGFSELSANVGGAVWGWTTAQSVWWLWMHTSVSIFIPLLLWAVDRAFDEKSFARFAGPASLVFLGFLSGGYPHWILLGFFSAGLYFLFEAKGRPLPDCARAALRLGAAFALAAAILLPSILISYRFLRETGQINLREGSAGRYPMPLRHLRLYLAPDYAGDTHADDYRGVGLANFENYVETAVGVGPFAIGFAVLAFANRRRRRFVLFAAALAGCIALPLYAGGPILRTVGAVPWAGVFLMERAKILIVFGIALASAAGVEALEGAFPRGAFAGRLLQAAPFLVAIPLVWEAAKFHTTSTPDAAIFHETPAVEALRKLQRAEPSRFLALGSVLYPNISEAFGLEDVRSHLMHEKDYRDLLAASDRNVFGQNGSFLIFHPSTLDASAPVLDLLGVTAIATAPRMEFPGSAGLPIRYDADDLRIYSRPSAFPRFFAVGSVRAGGVAEVCAASRDTLASTAFVAPDAAARLAGELAGSRPGSARIAIQDYRSESFSLDVETATPVLLASSQKILDRYWRAFIDDKETPNLRCDGVFLGVFVPAGRHHIEGRFMIPPVEKFAAAAGFFMLAILLGAAAKRNRI